MTDLIEREELSEHEKFILSQMANSDVKTVEEIGLMHQKQLAEKMSVTTKEKYFKDLAIKQTDMNAK